MKKVDEGKQASALVVEDDDDIAFLLKFILEREGFEVHVAGDGRQAQEAIGKLAPPAIVTLDIMLPYVDGLQLLEQIRAKRGWKTLPVLMLTAKAQEKDIVHALDAGANDYIVKPFQPDEMRARVRRLVKAKP